MRRNLAAARLAVLSQLEYRVNFLVDAVIQPVLASGVEVLMWSVIMAGLATDTLGGFGKEYYLAYALWANFVGRVTTNWMYEFTMLDEIETGKVNAVLVRPISYYEFFLSQFLGYKLVIGLISFSFPALACYLMGASLHYERIPLMILFCAYYLIFVHTVSFCVACLAFFMNRASSFTGIKNMAIWVLAGEMIPLDLYPEPFKNFMIHSPFASGVYVPVGFITGRFGYEFLWQSLISVTIGIVVFGLLARFLWRRGLLAYTGTGA